MNTISKVSKFLLAGALAFSSLPVYALGVDVGVKADVEVKGNATSTAATSKVSVGNEVSAEASEVNGWSDSEKKDFLTTVKAHASLKSGQDLDNFAKGVMVKDKNVDGVVADNNEVEVHYKLPAKFLGIFSANLNSITNVSFETTNTGRGPKEVTVKFPWYKMFFSLSTSTREEVLQTAIKKGVDIDAQIPRDNEYAQNGVTINIVSNILKAIRAKIELNSTTTVK